MIFAFGLGNYQQGLTQFMEYPGIELCFEKLFGAGRGGGGRRGREGFKKVFILQTLPQKIPEKAKLQSWKLCKFLLDPLDSLRPKTKIPGNSILLFLAHPLKFHFVFK